MTDSLGGARVALLEARMESELASLVRRHGGEPLCVPALREVERECSDESAAAIDAVEHAGAVVVLATGVGLARWLVMAASLGRLDALRSALARATVVCRGPKPVAVLKREGLTAHVRAEPPHTTAELLAALAAIDVTGRDVVFVHDGGGGPTVPGALRGRGARVAEIRPYGWALPADLQPLRDLCGAIVDGRVDAVAFTTQIQARHLFEVAERAALRDAIARAMHASVLVAAVGPTSARALVDLGVPPHVVPAQGKMGAMVVALAEAMTARRGGAGSTG